MDKAAEEAEERRDGWFDRSSLDLKKPSKAVVEEEELSLPKLAREGLLLRNSKDRLRISRREEIED